MKGPIQKPWPRLGCRKIEHAVPDLSISLAILPIALALLTGWATVATGLIAREKWEGVEALSFRILVPAMLISAMSGAELSFSAIGPLALAMLGATAVGGLTVLAIRILVPASHLPGPSLSTLFQTTTRWNAFISLAAAQQLAGADGLALIAISMAVMIPLINISNVTVVVAFGPGTVSVRHILWSVAKNPLIIGCALGIGINLSGLQLPDPVASTVDMMARSALGVSLLAVGSGIRPRRLLQGSPAVWTGIALRLLLVPMAFVALATWLDLSGLALLTGLLICAAPAASNGYVLARQMGGDAELYADILTWQTVASMLTIPAFVLLFS